MKVADLIALLAPLSERNINLCHGDRVVDLDRESLTIVDENTAAFYLPAPPARVTLLDDALRTLTDWVRRAELRITALEESSDTGEIDYSELAREINCSVLAGEIDASDVAEHLDMTDVVEDVLRQCRFRLE